MYYLQALRFKVLWVQQLNLNQNTLSLSAPAEALQANIFLPEDVLGSMILVRCTCCRLLLGIHWLVPCIFNQIWSSFPVWFNIFLEICLWSSCYLCLIASKWTPADLLRLSAEHTLCFLEHAHLCKVFGINVRRSRQNSLSFLQLLSVDKHMDSKYCPFICWEGVALTAGILPCQNPAGNMDWERQEHGALIFTVIRPCVLPAA